MLRSVFETVAYADVFDYPMTASEVYRYLSPIEASFEEVSGALAEESLFTRAGDYFTLHGREAIVEIRKRRAPIAAQLWGKALRYGRILAALPFVRMVAVTGSLAMNNTDEGKDVDFMIVTSPNRLWTCRALTLLVARIAKLEGVHLCPNYLVTTNALRLSERSLYVAHELVQMILLVVLKFMKSYFDLMIGSMSICRMPRASQNWLQQLARYEVGLFSNERLRSFSASLWEIGWRRGK
jgi:hypothetical protein